ncbi:hypothetical protein FHG64_01935 [Antarcticibacterium flavum]|uniref:Uncharacterized protein n=2 Tax=Flavobacteriaceae TaxID=49546 RepID=A0A5B7X879_9FLAO|nr:hypothetical protein [Antarcticibacterium sp. W02-3]QCY71335.1 hypothetical protein FHG64_01935 [Antarcticibacterium flavum]
MKKESRILLLGLAAITVGGFVYSQIYIHEQSRREIKEIANELALAWQEKLDLTLEQKLRLEDLIITYTIRKNAIINDSIPEYRKIQKLKKVQVKEHRNLKKILSDSQFNAYVGINKKIPDTIIDSVSAS